MGEMSTFKEEPETRLQKIMSSPQSLRVVGSIATVTGLGLYGFSDKGLGMTLTAIGIGVAKGSYNQIREARIEKRTDRRRQLLNL